MAESFPADLRYTESDEWVRVEDDEVVVGVTSFAAEQLGDVVYLKLPEVGDHYDQGQAYGEIESVKAVSDLYSPLGGEVLAVNDLLDTQPGLVNEDPYGAGWAVRMRPDTPAQIDALLDSAAYQQHTAERS